MITKRGFGIIASSIYLVIISIYFWTQSRYPGLFRKRENGLETEIGDSIAFNELIPHTLGEPKVAEIIISFSNWGFTNWKGMTFGVLFGIGMMTLLKYINTKKLPKNKLLLSLTGYIQGAGLGLCANCATPVGKSLVSSGVSPIVAINTIISSPTFNFVGLGLIVSVFAAPVVVVKLLFYIFIMLVVVPAIFGKYTPQCCIINFDMFKKKDQFPNLVSAVKENALFMLKKAVPMMALAGLIGVVIMAFFPSDMLTEIPANPFTVLMVSLISFIVPVPMFFDIIFSGIMLENGVPEIFVYTMLINLGGFSIYPLLVMKQYVSLKQLAYFSGIFILGAPIAAGFLAFIL